MTKQTGSIDLKAQKAAHDEASQTASNYIFKTTGHDAWVCDENAGPNESTGEAYGPSDANPTTGWRIGSVFELVRQGVSWFKLWVENNIVKLRLGKVDSGHIMLDADSMDVLDSSSDTIASFGADGAQIGKSDESHVIIGSNSIKMSESTSNLFTIEFDGLVNIINSGGDTSAKPYSNNDINSIAAMLNTGYTVNDSIVFDPEGNRTLYTIARNVVNNRFGNMICSPNLYIYYDDTSGIFEPSTLMTPQVDHDSIPTLIAMGETSVKATGDNLEIYAGGIATGNNSIASGQYSHAEGVVCRVGNNVYSTTASGTASHAEGCGTAASGYSSHSEGQLTEASGSHSHAEGYSAKAQGGYSHSEGRLTKATGQEAHAQNVGTIAASRAQTALGRYNIEDANDTYAVIVGNGGYAAGDARSNALTVDWDGKATLYSGNIADGTAPEAAINGTGGVSMVDTNGTELGYVRPRFYANGMQYYDMGASRNVNGSTVTHGLMLGIDASGKKEVTLNYDAWRTALEIVNILTLKSPSTSSAAIDTSTNNGATSSAVVFGRTEIMDKNGTWVSTYGSNTQTNGQTRSYIGCNNMKTDGTMVANYLNIGVNKDGSRFYAMTDPAAFRTALGFGDGKWETQDDTGPAVSVANSSWVKLTQVTLTAGHWLVLVGGYAASNNTGRRGFHLSSASSVTASRFLSALMAPPSGTALYTVIPYLVNPTASTTYNIFGYQNSGGNLNMSALVRAIHIYTA